MDDVDGDFQRTWRDQRDHLWRVAWLICGDPDLADDVVGAAVARCWRGWDKRKVSDPRAYLRRAVVHEATDRFRRLGRERRWRERRTGDGRGARSLDEQVADRADLATALAALPVAQRAVLVLRYWADLSEADTADALAISVGTVKSRTSRALVALAVVLDPDQHPTTEAFDA